MIQIYDERDIKEYQKDVPCTCTMQFFVRNKRLDMITYMRSNDAYKGLPHDIFSFTMIQEVIARSLNLEIGIYKHAVGSLHLYEEDIPRAEALISEGFQSTFEMPSMPRGDPWESIDLVLRSEEKIRTGQPIRLRHLKLHPYWKDLLRILQIFHYTKDESKLKKVSDVIRQMSSPVFDFYLKRRYERFVDRIKPSQLDLLSNVIKEGNEINN